jgi:DNA polymerase V
VAQLNLFDDTAPRANATALMNILDSVNQRNGRGTLFFAGQGIEKKWQMKREMLSPRWTTRLKDVPSVF